MAGCKDQPGKTFENGIETPESPKGDFGEVFLFNCSSLVQNYSTDEQYSAAH